MAQIILLKEVYETKRAKEHELMFYKEQMKMLEERMTLVRKEIDVTNKIIQIIEKEIKSKLI